MLCFSEQCKLKLMELMKVVATVSAMSPKGKIDNNNTKDVAIKEKAKEMWKHMERDKYKCWQADSGVNIAKLSLVQA